MPAPSPSPSPFPSSQPPQPFPALYLYPINDSFVPKHIALLNNQHVKIGRQTNAKTAPGERNGFFDSKVLSRQHAEVWEEGSKIFIKDVKSSNGTFINGERLSPESVESEPFELKSDDIVEFGIDIVGEDNKTIIHHKVAARVVCVFNEQDVQVAARAEQHQQQQQQYHQGAAGLHSGQPNPNGSAGTFNFAGAQQQRRTQLAQQGLTGMGGMGGNIRPPGKSGLSFELIFSRLQGELQKTKDTGAELQNLTSALGEIQDTLGGALPHDMPPPPHALPPIRPPQPQPQVGESSTTAANAPPEAPAQPQSIVSTETLLEIQTRLQDTQSSLASHVDKIRALETILAEQEALKREMRLLRDIIEARERDPVLVTAQEADREKDGHPFKKPRSNFDDDDDDDDDDDARSVVTITNGELERVDEEVEDHVEREDRHHLEDAEIHDPGSETDEEKHRRREELGRPRTPEPTMGMHAVILNGTSHRSRSPSQSQTGKAAPVQPDTKEISDQVSALSEQVRAVLAVKSALEAQHVAAQATIQALEKKVETLEAAVKTAQEHSAAVQAAPSPPIQLPVTIIQDEPKETLSDILSEWKKSVQGQWTSVQEEWSQERERLSRVREEFEAKTRQVDEGLERISGLESTVSAVQQTQTTQGSQLTTLQTWMSRIQDSTSWFQQPHANGDSIRHGMSSGLVTPPSPPRSRSSDSSRYARRRRRRSAGAAARRTEANGNDADEGSSPSSSPASSPERGGSRSRSRERRRGGRGADSDPDAPHGSDDHLPHSHGHARERTAQKLVTLLKKRVGVKEEEDYDDDVRMLALAGEMKTYISMINPEKSLATPDPSVVDRASLSGSITSSVDPEEGDEPESEVRKKPVELEPVPLMNVQTAIGVLILGVATAAVVWRIKPE